MLVYIDVAIDWCVLAMGIVLTEGILFFDE